jgi:hypothetical protein
LLLLDDEVLPGAVVAEVAGVFAVEVIGADRVGAADGVVGQPEGL